MQLAYTSSVFRVRERRRPCAARAGAPAAPAGTGVLARGGRGVNAGRAVVAAFPAAGGPIVAWVKPGDRNEEGGPLEVFAERRAAGARRGREGLSLAGGPGGSAVLGWSPPWATSTRRDAAAGGRAVRPGRQARRRRLAVGRDDAAGEALALWQGGVAFHPPD